jgi:hypothetical protein
MREREKPVRTTQNHCWKKSGGCKGGLNFRSGQLGRSVLLISSGNIVGLGIHFKQNIGIPVLTGLELDQKLILLNG